MQKSAMHFLLVLLWVSLALAGHAQEKTITGTVTDNSNNPLAGVTVKVKGTNRAVQTDAGGRFSLKARNGETLTFSHVGFNLQNVKVTDLANVQVKLVISDAQLGEVVVTAMDIKRNPRELGYSVQKIGGKEIQDARRENFLNSLQGRVAGLTVTPTSGLAGASSQIILRGFNSMSLSNQPLFVIDGIIIDNSTLNETSNGGTALGLASDRPNRNSDYTNRIADLNPNDIDAVTVLKGPEATALYGSQASSGAIIITTKKATPGKTSITYDNSFRFQKVTRYADLNNDYSLGNNGIPTSTPGAGFTYFGPAYGADTKKYDNVRNFFRTGFAQTHNITAEMGTKNAGLRLSSSYFGDQSIIPNNSFNKFNIRLANTTKIGKYLNITPSVQYITSTNGKPIRGAGGYLLDLYDWPVDNDIRNYLDAGGNKRVLYAADYNSEADNPFFSVYKNHAQDKTNRFIGTLGIDINPFSWLSVSGRFGYDHYNTNGYSFYHPESSQYSRTTGGFLDNYWRKYDGYNHTITATARKNFGKFSGRVMVGTMWQDYETKMYAISGSKLKDSVSTDSSNTSPNTRVRLARNAYGQWNESIIRQIAYFGEAGISYNNVLFLNYTHRFEAASVFTKKNRNYNYPGFSVSAIVSDIIPGIKGKVLNYAKLRSSLAGTARLPDPYKNQSVFVNNFASANGPIFSYGFDNNNPDLKPEKQQTYEIGGEFRLLNNSLTIDAAYYNTLCTDQISQQFRASYATGFVLNTQNAASTRNEGIEISLGVNPVHSGDWNWSLLFNFNHMWSKVLKLPDAIQYEYYIADTWLYANARGGLIRNSPTTTITGYHYTRNKRGDILINPATGLPVVDPTFSVIGNRSPKFTLGTTSNLRYKNWNLSFLWDLKVGGDIFNATDMYLTTVGKSQRTADRKTPRVIKGVLKDGLENTDHPTANAILVTPYYTNSYYQETSGMPDEEFVQHNVNWLRLRDITLSYSLPSGKLQFLKGLKTLSFFVTGNDLLLFTNYGGVDPAVNGNTPGSSGVGGFGFDYGNLANPISVNFGLRAGF